MKSSDDSGKYISFASKTNKIRRRLTAALPILSLLVVLVVFWWLKLTGITLAGEAFCGNTEHIHSEDCIVKTLTCTQPEETTGPDTAPDTTSEDTTTEDTTTEDTTAEDTTTEDTTAEDTTAEDTTAEDTTAEDTTAEGTTAEDTTAEDTTAEDTTAEDTTTEDTTAEDTTTEDTTAEDTTTEDTTAEDTTAEDTTAPAPSAPAHVHTDECYEISYGCGLEEHIHTSDCYSDITADLETADDWEATISHVSSSMGTTEKIIEIARSQIGYTESTLNFIVDANGVRRGYTRYGEWFGNPYGDWSNMFTAFCMRYAGLTDIPVSAGADTLHLEWTEKGIFKAAENYSPLIGDVVFLDKNANGIPDSTAIITAVSNGVLSVIEGDLENKVDETVYEIGSSTVFGYGMVVPAKAPILMSTPPLMMNAAPIADTGSTYLGITSNYNTSLLSSGGLYVVYTQGSDGNYYAIDGNGKAVRVYIGSDGRVTCDISDANLLYWSFTRHESNYDNQPAYYIQNASTQMYLHPFRNSDTDYNAILSGRWESALYQNGNGVRIRGARQNAYAVLRNNTDFSIATALNSGSTMYFAKKPATCTVWLDGTCGNLMSLGGSLNKSYSVLEGSKMKLPETWQSPAKYSYTLRGWYDVTNSKYYAPGTEVTVTGNAVFYADWVASTYDIGIYNSQTTNTISTSDFITTRVFDYGPLFNVMSARVSSSSITASSHSETWSIVSSGNVPYKNSPTFNYIFRDWDTNSYLSYPRDSVNHNTNGSVLAGLYTEQMGEVLFSPDNSFDPLTGEGIIGKNYLGEGDYLFQLDTDPNSETYGYYYYDSARNAASYNQTDQRFYVYDYLERTSDSQSADVGKYSDFLPFNSPYANTNGKTVVNYTYDGDHGEFVGVNHCQYDAQYNTSASSQNNVSTNYMFGMSMDVHFYLPVAPGTRDSDGNYGNLDVYGKQMHFKFSGDDDVWIFIDGKLALDIGGIHGIESGDINFSTGVVTVNGQQVSTLSGVGAGDHVMTVYYLERGSSQSNCALYFNLAPRFALSLQKEDVLTREYLNGAQFSVFTDKECTVPANLWTSKESHDKGDPAINVFTIENGVANIWGMGAGNTYYIRETSPPLKEEYSTAYGIICVSLDKTGSASYDVEIISETDEDGNIISTSPGFAVHGFRIDEQTQQAYIIVTNAPEWVKETTTVQAVKKWDDTKDHSEDSVVVYLTVTDSDGTVRRLREITLSEENDWRYIWTNLPKYEKDGVTLVKYGVEEAYKTGYYPTVEELDESEITTEKWAEALSFKTGGVYVLSSNNGYLSAQSTSSQALCWVDADTAKNSPLALWTATVSGSNVKLKNGAGQWLTFNSGYTSSNRYFYVTTTANSYQNLIPVEYNGALTMYATRYSTAYYLSGIASNGNGSTSTSQSSAVQFTPLTYITETDTLESTDFAYKITNTPLEKETALTVTKTWDLGMASNSVDYEKAQVTVKLLANGRDTNRSVTLSLKNGWTDTFLGLPYMDNEGNVISYSVLETWETEDWTPIYGEVKASDGEIPTYSVTVTNRYNWGNGYELPSTGGIGSAIWILSGLALMLGALVSGLIIRYCGKGGENGQPPEKSSLSRDDESDK